MTRRITSYPSPGPENSLWHWSKIVPAHRVMRNYILMRIARVVPSMQFRIALLRRMGARIGNNVSWGLEATMDIFFPEHISIGDDSIIGYKSVILAHEFLLREYRVGEVLIGKGVLIGANCTILPGVRIADGSVIAAGSLVNSDVDGFVGGVPARPIPSTHEKNIPP